MKIQGTLTTRAPLMIARPNAGDVKVNLSGRYAKTGFPATEVVRMTLPGIGAIHEKTSVPVISANTLRGGLRRAGAALVEDALKARGETIKLGTYHALRCGTPYGHPDKSSPALSEIQQAQVTPPLAVFGGGPRMIESALRVDTGFPVLPALIERGMLSDSLLATAMPADSRLTMFLFLRRADDAANFVDHDMAEHVVGKYADAIDAWQELIGKGADVDAVKDDEDGTKDLGKLRGLAALTAFEIVLPGSVFSFGMDIETEHPASVGFALLSLAGFANAQRLGGYGRLGFGRFSLDLSTDGGSPLKLINDVYEPNTDVEAIATAVKAAHDWLSKVSAADLDALMLPSTTSLQDVRKKLKNDKDAEAAFDKVFGKGQ